jgi:hypothetical protein
MSHEPRIPEAARSPFPLQSPPAAGQRDGDAQPQGQTASAQDGQQDGNGEQSWADRARDGFERATESKVALGAAVGIGSAALLAALMFSRRGSGKREANASAGGTSKRADKPAGA